MTACALGFADHSGWAIVVAVANDGGRVRVLHRERITTIAADIPRQPYHAVAEGGAPHSVIPAAEESAAECSAVAIEAICANLGTGGHEVVAAGVPAGTATLPELERILASHTLLHAAEGELFRDALAEGASRAGIPAVLRFPRKAVLEMAAASATLSIDGWDARLSAVREELGAPWTADHKLAASAAWLALDASSTKRRQ